MNEFRFSSRASMFNYYRNTNSSDCPITFSEILDHSGFDFYNSSIEIAEQCLIDVWLRANELFRTGHPTPMKKAAMDTWRKVIVRKQYAKNRYWVVREDRDISVDDISSGEPQSCDPWLVEAICQELEKRDLVEKIFSIVGLPVAEASHRKSDLVLDNPC